MSATIAETVSALFPCGFGFCSFRDCLPLPHVRATSRLPVDARSVIVLEFPYWIGDASPRNVARYAVVADYHRVAMRLLEEIAARLRSRWPGEAFVPFVDNAPLAEVDAARRAGLGPVGLHGQLISAAFGSHVFLGEIVTTLPIPPSAPVREPCLRCGRCVAACPTGALTPGNPLRLDRCRSHITQKKGDLSPWERDQVAAGGLAWGCDLCTDACPLNKPTPTPLEEFHRNPQPLLTLENLDRLRKTQAYGYRGRAVLLRNLDLLAQNPPRPSHK